MIKLSCDLDGYLTYIFHGTLITLFTNITIVLFIEFLSTQTQEGQIAKYYQNQKTTREYNIFSRWLCVSIKIQIKNITGRTTVLHIRKSVKSVIHTLVKYFCIRSYDILWLLTISELLGVMSLITLPSPPNPRKSQAGQREGPEFSPLPHSLILSAGIL